MTARRGGSRGGANTKLLGARLRLPSPSRGDQAMSTADVAQAINEYLWQERKMVVAVDHRFVSNYEAGTHWWPSEHYREAFRHVLKVETDADLGFESRRTRTTRASDTVVRPGMDGPAGGTDMRRLEEADRGRRALILGATAMTAGLTSMPRSLLMMAADESALLGTAAEPSPLASSSVATLREDLHRLTTDYVVTSNLPRILGDALIARDRLSVLIDHRRLRLQDMREVHIMMSAVCLLLASISHDFGESGAGMLQANSAEVFADVAGEPELQQWVLCTKAMIDLWRGRPHAVLEHAARGKAFGHASSASLRLAGLETRALAQLNRRTEAETQLRRSEKQHMDYSHTTALADLGPMFSFPRSRQNYYAAASYAQLGNLAETERLVAQVGHGDGAAPQVDGIWPVSWALSRGYLALARLDHAGNDGGPDGAMQALAPLLALPDVQRINQLRQVFSDIDRRAAAPRLAESASGRALRSAVRSFRTISPKTVTA